MRILLILIVLCLVEGEANASWWYILDKDERVIAKQNGEPKAEKLEMDGMFSVKSELDIDVLKAEYKNKKIVEHQKTKAEKDAEDKKKADKESAINKLKGLGLTEDEIESIK